MAGKVDITNDNREVIKRELHAKIERALETIGMMAESEAKILAPVDTGRLRNSISHAVDVPTVSIGTNVEYAPYQELGTANNPSGNPFLKPAVEGQFDAYRQVVENELKG